MKEIGSETRNKGKVYSAQLKETMKANGKAIKNMDVEFSG
jgi:hypothetical protein